MLSSIALLKCLCNKLVEINAHGRFRKILWNLHSTNVGETYVNAIAKLYFFLQDLHFHTSAIVSLQNTSKVIFTYFLWYQSWEAHQGAIKLSFFRVLLKISGRCSPVSAVNILSDIIALALFVVFHLLLGMEKTCLALNIYSSESWVMPALELDCHQVQGQLQKHKKKFRNQLGSIVIVLAGP